MRKDPIDSLRALGLTDYEIKAYVALLRSGPMNGYQVAKASGVPRANVYQVLERLEKRGAVVSTAAEDGAHYHALPAEEMLERLSHSFKDDVSRAREALQNLDGASDHPLAWNLRGYDSILAKADRMLEGTKKHALIGLWPEEAGRLTRSFSRLISDGIRPTILCLHGCEKDCGGCAGKLYRYPVAADDSAFRTLLLTTDGHETLVAQIHRDGTAVAAHSSTEVLAAMAEQHILNAIAVAEIVRSLGPRLLSTVDPAAMAAVKQAGLDIGQSTWFDRIVRTFSKSDR